MAHFAQVAYRDDLVVKSKEYSQSGELKSVKISEDNLDSACDYLSPEVPIPTFGMPYLLPSDLSLPDEAEQIGRWSRWRGSSHIASEPCYDHNGLFYETYIYISGSTIQEAVIAFRGTENTGSQFWHDWTTNLANFFGFEPKQYKIAAEKIPKVIEALKSENPKVEIYATGHSLGGGLANKRVIYQKISKKFSPLTQVQSPTGPALH
ncbi:lipase family protein [Desulfosarcina cetonica]|uniref:lipase family protein n=1 Tax=Desulfosarcina cetonica TaxID=90730 RepID=UPI0006CF3A3A|nr:DUF6792 domain-containing protein [Desulfosarcina cetonica]